MSYKIQPHGHGTNNFYWQLCLCLLWPSPFDLMSMSQRQVHTWANFYEISWNSYKKLYSPSFSGHYLRWPWPLIPKASQYYKPKYIYDKTITVPTLRKCMSCYATAYSKSPNECPRCLFVQYIRTPGVYWRPGVYYIMLYRPVARKFVQLLTRDVPIV